jgi:type I restriction enzyme M protein
MAQAVARSRIGDGGDFNLSGDRYIAATMTPSKFPQVSIGDVVTALTPPSKIQKTDYQNTGRFPIIDQSQDAIAGWTDDEKSLVRAEKPLVIFGDHTCSVKWLSHPFAQGADGIKILLTSDTLAPRFLYFFLQTHPLEADGYKRHFGDLKLKTIPLPPLEVQQQIVAEIEGYQQVIDGARLVLDGYRPSVAMDPSWPVERLGDIFQTKSGTTPARDTPAYFEGGHIPWVKTLDLRDGGLRATEERVTDLALAQTHLDKLPIGTVLVAMYGGLKQIGRTGVLEIEATCNQAMTALLPSPRVDPYFLNVVLISQRDYWKSVANSTRKDPNITKSDVLNFKLPLPDLTTQRAIVAEIEAEQGLVNANRELIRRMETKIKVAIDRVWGAGE